MTRVYYTLEAPIFGELNSPRACDSCTEPVEVMVSRHEIVEVYRVLDAEERDQSSRARRQRASTPASAHSVGIPVLTSRDRDGILMRVKSYLQRFSRE